MICESLSQPLDVGVCLCFDDDLVTNWIFHRVQNKIDFYLWNFKSTIRRMCLFMFWCWACHKTESTDLPSEYDHVCHGVGGAWVAKGQRCQGCQGIKVTSNKGA